VPASVSGRPRGRAAAIADSAASAALEALAVLRTITSDSTVPADIKVKAARAVLDHEQKIQQNEGVLRRLSNLEQRLQEGGRQ
jgi:hypothetical protein